MADIESIKCPGCGASLRYDGWASTVTCPYCSTVARIQRPAPAPAESATPAGNARHPLQDERDEVAARLAQQEREWNARIAKSGNRKRAEELTAQRELAVGPMRMRLKKLDDRISGRESSDPRQRLRALEAERREIAAYIDKVLTHVENVRNSSAAVDLFSAGLVGCVPAFVAFLTVSLVVTGMYANPENLGPSAALWFFGAWLAGTIVAWVVRRIRHGKRLARLVEARDAVIPDCQKQLEKIEAEIASLT